MKSKCANPRFPADYIVFMRGQCDENNHVNAIKVFQQLEKELSARGKLLPR